MRAAFLIIAASVAAALGTGAAVGDQAFSSKASAASTCDTAALIEQAKSTLLLTTKSGTWYAGHLGAPGYWTDAWNLLNQAEACATPPPTTTTATTDPTTTASTTTAPSPPTGTVFCFGDPTYGFQGNYTSNGWGRQYPFNHPERVSFDDSVNVMQSLGCHTVRAELQAGDKDTQNGTSNLRAQLYKDPNQALYDAMGTNPGQTTWYGLAFSTNAGYVPQSDPNFPVWNVIFTWHGTLDGGGNPLSIEIATKGYSDTDCSAPGFGYVPFADGQPRLMLEVNGGDPAKWPTGGATCRRFPGPIFVAGHLYRVEEKVTWSDSGQGAVEWWVDGTKYADATGISTMQLGGRVWALFENYRPYASSFPTADVYYGGLVKGDSRAAVAVP